MPHPHPLSARLERLRRQLRSHQPVLDDAEGGELIWAAVAVVLVPGPDALLLIRRAEREGDPWSGHMALPGGRRDSGDAGLTDTAVRETAEEVGLGLRADQVVGTLDDVVPRTPVLPPIAVRPFVFLLHSRPALTLNPEVADARWVPLDDLLHPDSYHPVRFEIRGESRNMPAYVLEDAVVWGMTERVVTSLLAQL